MKFLSKISKVYEAQGLSKPSWILEYDGGTAGQAVPVAPAAAPGMAGKSVIDSLYNAMSVLSKKSPAVQQVMTTLTQTTADAEKKLADATNKVVDKIKKTMDDLNKNITAPTPATSNVASTTPAVPATSVAPSVP